MLVVGAFFAGIRFEQERERRQDEAAVLEAKARQRQRVRTASAGAKRSTTHFSEVIARRSLEALGVSPRKVTPKGRSIDSTLDKVDCPRLLPSGSA
jgi:type II secretory pathway component PulM